MPRSRYTRSGRTAATAPTVAAVMIPSPMPISTCRPTISVNTVPSEAPPAPPIAYSTRSASDATTVLTNAATNAVATSPARPRRASGRRATATA